MSFRRPLPAPPDQLSPMGPKAYQYPPPRSADMYGSIDPYYMPQHYPPYLYAPPSQQPDLYEEPVTSFIPVGTILHKGFYDLLSMIPTPSPSRLLWRASPPSIHSVAGPRYEDLDSARIKAMPKKGRRVSKDMVSKPTGFVYVSRNYVFLYFDFTRHLVHASDVDQMEALLTRWGPDGIGKLGGSLTFCLASSRTSDKILSQILIGPTRSRITSDNRIKQGLSTK